ASSDWGRRSLCGRRYNVLSSQYGRPSSGDRRLIILTSNRAPEEWAEVFGNSLLVLAALGRLKHHARFIEMKGGDT
ncbi:ATP-binding protein, partial [Candidatus Bipolaricaulota bacterium]|nr:ATP-binding protein [Candidatus Bipolaricaulota bacterium]